ncbi:hypothetical protein BCR32DRAFT_289230 [Anaeromyces robustus]|jgi:hypothetical protein|uniref:Uncharacterized protein n=1 Tax=Anaeromyces robustus TaxID=1754192 RepID=A0A1Y1XPI5_9FUNG|nr:hypothetical protein BCR32DRAFT_289230 [Anaeromyces robustus]|eukprot:ORX87575.1 hypothetical protein BCR32DRAFT_289230 [Anaeromyces robustus]
MDYTKLLLLFCLLVALTQAIPLDLSKLFGGDDDDEPLFGGIGKALEDDDIDTLPPKSLPVADEDSLPTSSKTLPPEDNLPPKSLDEDITLPTKDLPEGLDTLPTKNLDDEMTTTESLPPKSIDESSLPTKSLDDETLPPKDIPQAPAQPPVIHTSQDEPIYVDPEADQVPKDISTDTMGAVSDNIGNITNDIIGNISYNIKTALEKELGTETNDESSNDMINNVVVDLLTATAEDLKVAIGDLLNNDLNTGDFETIAKETGLKVAQVLGHNVITAIAKNINLNLDFEDIANNVLNDTSENVSSFVKKALLTSEAVVEDTTTNETSTDISVSNANDVSTMVTNGISYLIKSTLCQNLGDANAASVCENIANTVIVSGAGILNKVISGAINSATGGGLSIACSLIPGELFKQLLGTLTNAIAGAINKDDENASAIANNVITIIINTVENLLCGGKTAAATGSDNVGSVIIKDIAGLANHIINKVNYMNEDVANSLRKEVKVDGIPDVSDNIANAIANIQTAIVEASS